MVAGHVYTNAIAKMANKEIDLDSDTIKVALTTSSYTPSQGTHDYFSDVTNEVSGTGYTAGGATLSSKTVSVSGTTFTFDAADTVWSASTIANARYAVIYDATPGSAATNPLIAYVDFVTDRSTTAGTFTITWDAAGIFAATVS
jgi:hypothetical protein